MDKIVVNKRRVEEIRDERKKTGKCCYTTPVQPTASDRIAYLRRESKKVLAEIAITRD